MNQNEWYAVRVEDQKRMITQDQARYYQQQMGAQMNMGNQWNDIASNDLTNLWNKNTPQGKLYAAKLIAEDVRNRNPKMQVKKI